MLEVSVYATNDDYIKKHRALCRRIDCDNFHVPYDRLIDAFHCLFGNSCIVEFIVT